MARTNKDSIVFNQNRLETYEYELTLCSDDKFRKKVLEWMISVTEKIIKLYQQRLEKNDIK
jgi:hypothetical protein